MKVRYIFLYHSLIIGQDFKIPFEPGKGDTKSVTFELYDEDSTIRGDKDDLIG
jgi:hypothetical protein